MTLLDAFGQPVPVIPPDAFGRAGATPAAQLEVEVAAACPRCGRIQHEVVSGFGPGWRDLCGHCGHLFASGSGEPPAGSDEA